MRLASCLVCNVLEARNLCIEAEFFLIDSLELSQYYGAAQLPDKQQKLSDTNFADLTF